MRELDEKVEERNYAKKPLTREELEEILSVVSVADAVNTRHELAKEKGWKAAPPTKAAFITAALEDNNLLRRPILINKGRAVVGKDAAELRGLLK